MTTLIPRLMALLFLLMIAASGANAQNSRLTVFISDTHFGPGQIAPGKWHAYEDARWAPEFKLFLEALNREGQGNTDLILNGDTFELWQSLEHDCIYSDDNLGCTEPDALRRLKTVIGAHQAELDAIRSFANAGNNRVVILPGNHDAALRFPAVAAGVANAIGAAADRLTISTSGYWVSADGLIYAEHGHQIGRDTNLFSNWPNPFVEENGVLHLQRPWGEQFVQVFYNSYEMKYPIIDNMGDVVGVKYGIAAEGKLGLIRALGKFVVFNLLQSSWSQVSQSLGGGEKGVKWDTAAIRKGGNRFFYESIPTDDPLRAEIEKSLSDGTLDIDLRELTDEDLRSICDLRAAIVAADTRNKKSPRLTLCPKPNLGSLSTSLITSRNSIFQKHLTDTLTRRRAAGNVKPFVLFVFAHTHEAESSYSPFARSSSSWRPIVVNSGAWQRTFSEQQLQSYMKEKNLGEKDVLKLDPENLPPCYPVITVPPYSSNPRSLLRYWRQVGNTWSFADKCN